MTPLGHQRVKRSYGTPKKFVKIFSKLWSGSGKPLLSSLSLFHVFTHFAQAILKHTLYIFMKTLYL